MTLQPSIAAPEAARAARPTNLQATNPRRTPPRDVRLLNDGRKRQKLSLSPPQLQSQESTSDQSASKWFDNANINVDPNRREQPVKDDEPPFYMSGRPNYVPKSLPVSDSERVFGTQSRLDSENEDLRGVIDDLTIENKRLRNILKTHQRQRRGSPTSTCRTPQDKLFEVRMHGLTPDKRRELEYLLKNFATSVHTSVRSKATSNTSGSGVSSTGQTNLLKATHTDSGYVSNSNSGQNPAPSHNAHLERTSKSRSIRNYLHDIPDSLLPRQSPIMSESAKMGLVVRRLENLFTGRTATPGEHTQPQQQQEVSNLAARAEQQRDARSHPKSKFEGVREAHILPADSKVNLDIVDLNESRDRSLNSKVRPDVQVSEGSPSSQSGSPDQRPTRPLDLDIHRAQVGAENIQYIRHLGLFASHDGLVHEDENRPWLYLNLLISMAQLHTLNVTPEFVRRSIKKLSKKFEVSKDGRTVRWIGGPDGTKFSSEEEKALEAADSGPHDVGDDKSIGNRGSKRSQSNSTSNAAITSTAPSDDKVSGQRTSTVSKQQQTFSTNSNLPASNRTKTTQTGSLFDYKPIVLKDKPFTADDEIYLPDSESSYDSPSRDSSGLVHALSKSNLHQSEADEGLITFYNSPYFCTDFSAENAPSNLKTSKPAIIGDTLGLEAPVDFSESPLRHHDACYFAMQFAPKPYQSREDDEEGLMVNVPELGPLDRVGEDETVPRELEVCGLGSIFPEDNFALDVKVGMRHVHPAKGAHQRTVPFTGTQVPPRIGYAVDECRKIDLLPSRLPPPNYLVFASTSSSAGSDAGDDSEDSDESSSENLENAGPPALPPFLAHRSHSTANDADVDGEDGNESSMDMLAMARSADPRRIAEQERVYMINQPGARPVAGSLAATVGESRSASSTHADIKSVDGNVGDSDFDDDMDVDD